MSGYCCKVCGRSVVVFADGSKVWACAHVGGTVVARMEATVSGHGGVSEGKKAA